MGGQVVSKEIFTRYYESNFWQGLESKSGPGSDKAQTRILIKELELLMRRLKITSILDLPCGDWNWMQEVNLDGITYYGGDIVDSVIAENKRKFVDREKVIFRVIDIINDDLPPVDLILVRDCLIHFDIDSMFKALRNIKESDSDWLLTTHYPWLHREANESIEIGGYHRVDLTRPPFNFPPPRHIIFERDLHGWDADKSLALWRIDEMPV